MSDQGRCYTGSKFKNFCITNDIKQILTSPYNPTGNSIAERTNSTIISCLRIYKNKKISEIIKIIENRINYFLKRNINYAPIEITKKSNPLLGSNKLQINTDYFKKYNSTKENKGSTPFYQINDKVLLRNFNCMKLNDQWTGIYLVTAIDPMRSRVQITKGTKKEWHNVKNVKKYKEGQDVGINSTNRKKPRVNTRQIKSINTSEIKGDGARQDE